MIATAKVGIRWFVGCDIGERNVKMASERFAHEVTAKCAIGHLSEIYGAEVGRLRRWFLFYHLDGTERFVFSASSPFRHTRFNLA